MGGKTAAEAYDVLVLLQSKQRFNGETHMNMKATLKVVVVTFLVVAASSQCYALRLLSAVSTESEAQELGVKIRSEILGTNNIGV